MDSALSNTINETGAGFYAPHVLKTSLQRRLSLPEPGGRVQQQEAHSTQEALIWGGMLWVIAPL